MPSDAKQLDSSPRSTGPAGGQFECKVATHYALALLAGSEPFGLPGTILERIEFQRRGQGHPLDDIILRGSGRNGEVRCLEIQAKRSLAFTENNPDFASIVKGIIEGRSVEPGRRFAVAIERTTATIENGVQEALELAHHTPDSDTFFNLLTTPGRSNEEMRRFVEAFRKQTSAIGGISEETLYEVLRSFSVLVFDFARPASFAEYFDRQRALRIGSSSNESNLYDAVFGLAVRFDAIGGGIDRSELIGKLKQLGANVGPNTSLSIARKHIKEISRFALSDINLTICKIRLPRDILRQKLEALLEETDDGSGVIEIGGPSGVGKSALLRTVVEAKEILTSVLVLSPDRIIPGGWPALRAALGISATAEELLNDLACDGGAILCVDGLDRFRDLGQRKTMVDLVQTALNNRGIKVLFTAQPGWEDEAVTWFDENSFSQLVSRKRLDVPDLDDLEARILGDAAPRLASLLGSEHPAKLFARNLMKLRLLLGARLSRDMPVSEVALARDWWSSGAQAYASGKGEIHARIRTLNAVAKGLLGGLTLVDVAAHDPGAVASLVADEVLIQVRTDLVRFRHDLIVDWAVAQVLTENVELPSSVSLEAPPPYWLARAFELSCRMLAEGVEKDAWKLRFARLEAGNAAVGWTGLALLALVRSELGDDLLDQEIDFLLEGKGDRAAHLIRRSIASHSKPLASIAKGLLPEGMEIPDGVSIPYGTEWPRLLAWCLKHFERFGAKPLSATVDLFGQWLVLAAFGESRFAPVLLDRLADIVVADIERKSLPLPRYWEEQPEIKFAVTNDAMQGARINMAMWATSAPAACAKLLKVVAKSRYPEAEMRLLLEFPGKLPGAAPKEFADALRATLGEQGEDSEKENVRSHRHRRSSGTFHVDSPFVLGKCGISVFSDILESDSRTGVALVVSLTRAACEPIQNESVFPVTLLDRTYKVEAPYSYGWSRGRSPSSMLSKALLALEYWAHKNLDRGKRVEEVVADIAGEGTVLGAIWLVIVDLVLSHAKLDSKILAELCASPQTLVLDAARANLDSVDRMSGGSITSYRRSGLAADQEIEKNLNERLSRGISLLNVIPQILFGAHRNSIDFIQTELESQVKRLGVWEDDSVDWESPKFMASYGLRLTAKDNYSEATSQDKEGNEQKGWAYKWPPNQEKWLSEHYASINAEHKSFSMALAVRSAMDRETATKHASVADAQSILDETATSVPLYEAGAPDPNDKWLSRVAAAAFLARYATVDQFHASADKIKSIFHQSLQLGEHERPSFHSGIMYDACSIALVGRLYLASNSTDRSPVDDLMTEVAKFPAQAANVFHRYPKTVLSLNSKLGISLCRIGMEACHMPRRSNYDESPEGYESRRNSHKTLLADRIESERAWLDGGREPNWPCPLQLKRRRKSVRLRIGTPVIETELISEKQEWPDFYFDEQTGSVWLKILCKFADGAARISESMWRANQKWLLEGHTGDDIYCERSVEQSWLCGLVELAAAGARHWSAKLRQELIYKVFHRFCDDDFLIGAATLINQGDLRYIGGDDEDRAYLVSIREAMWQKLKTTRHWTSHLRSHSDGMEIHLKELMCAFFMRVWGGFGNGTAYTKGLGDREIGLFLPILSEIALAAPSCPTTAWLYLDVLKCNSAELAVKPLAIVAQSWAKNANSRFWNDLGIGTHVLAIASKVEKLNDREQWFAVTDAMMAAGVAVEATFFHRLNGHVAE